MKTELSNIYYELKALREEIRLQNVIKAQQNEILKELVYQNENGSRVLKVDTRLINLKFGEILIMEEEK